MYEKIFEILNKQKHLVLLNKCNEIEKFIEPYKKINDDWEEIIIPNEEVALKYEQLQKELSQIIKEISLMSVN